MTNRLRFSNVLLRKCDKLFDPLPDAVVAKVLKNVAKLQLHVLVKLHVDQTAAVQTLK